MELPELLKLRDEVCTLSNSVADFLMAELGKVGGGDIEIKEKNSLVSYVDKMAEKMIVDRLGQLLPEAGFITEEDTDDQRGKPYTWIIDPLDGTTNYLYQIPYFSISIALAKGDDIVLGVVHEPSRNEQFSAIKGNGAYLNGKPVTVSKRNTSEALMVTGFPYSRDHKIEQAFKVMKYWLERGRGVRRLGSAAVDLCYVACGRTDGYYEATLNVWDVAAGSLIVKEAGGKISDFKGGEDYLYGHSILATAHQHFDELLDVVKKHFV